MTAVILFARKGKNYRMRLPRIHMHPGDCDVFEVASKDMLGNNSWNPVPAGCSDIPSGEWLARRALWRLIEGGSCSPSGAEVTAIDLGEI